MSVFKTVLGVVGLIVVFIGIGFILTGGDLLTYQFWGPKQAQAERQVFEHTQSYVEGKDARIANLEFQYKQATGDEKAALKTLILTEASTIDNSQLSPELQIFINSLKGSR